MKLLKTNEKLASLFFILYNCKILYNNEAVENLRESHLFFFILYNCKILYNNEDVEN